MILWPKTSEIRVNKQTNKQTDKTDNANYYVDYWVSASVPWSLTHVFTICVEYLVYFAFFCLFGSFFPLNWWQQCLLLFRVWMCCILNVKHELFFCSFYAWSIEYMPKNKVCTFGVTCGSKTVRSWWLRSYHLIFRPLLDNGLKGLLSVITLVYGVFDQVT